MKQKEHGFFDYFSSFQQWLEEDNPTDKAVVLYMNLFCMFNHQNWREWAIINTPRLMLLAHTTDMKTIRRARDELVRAGLIEYKTSKKGKPSEYRLLIRDVSSSKFPRKSDNRAVHETETKKENGSSMRKRKNETSSIGKNSKSHWKPSLPEGTETRFSAQMLAIITEWLTYKHEQWQEYKPTGMKSVLTQIEKKIAEFGETAVIDVIQLSMANNWKGIIWDKIKPTEKSTAQPTTETIDTEEDWMQFFEKGYKT